jgi:transcriptional regulator with GAF, ATPase, and Fis domain
VSPIVFAAATDSAFAGATAVTLWAVRRATGAGAPDVPGIASLLLLLCVALPGAFGLADGAILVFTAGDPPSLTMRSPPPLAVLILVMQIAAGVGLVRMLSERRGSPDRAAAEAGLALAQRRGEAARRSVAALGALSKQPLFCFELDPPVNVSLPVGEQVRRSYDAVLVDCNDAWIEAHPGRSRDELIGRRLGDMSAVIDTASHDRLVADFIRGGYALTDYERIDKFGSGAERTVLLRLVGVFDDGLLRFVWGSEQETARPRVPIADDRRDDVVQETLARVSTRLLTSSGDGIEDALTASLRDVCRFVQADRATIVWFDRIDAAVEVLHQWVESGPEATPRFRQEAFRWMFPLILDGESVGFSSLDELPDSAAVDAESLRGMGIRSAIVTPIVVEAETLGALSLTTSESEKHWTDSDYRGLRVIAASFGSAIARQRSDRRLAELMVELADARDRLEAENVYLQQEILSSHGFDELIGESRALRYCLEQAAQVAQTPAPVLILGETGTGKELLARAIHQRSQRSDRPLVKVNCAALPASLIESELFGHEKGAFTGAVARKPGRFDLADGGTIFLDEIGDLSPDLQAKLLRVLQEGEFQRVGGTKTVQVNVRLIAATNRQLLEAIEAGRFRADLYYRINTFTIELPPLRKRQGDIALLAQHFVTKHSQRLGKKIDSISRTALEQLEAHDWPGNVRELESVIQRAVISASGSQLQVPGGLGKRRVEAGPDEQHVPSPVRPRDLRSAEIAHITAVLEQCRWKITGADGAASKLGLPPSTLRSRMQKYDIRRPQTPA